MSSKIKPERVYLESQPIVMLYITFRYQELHPISEKYKWNESRIKNQIKYCKNLDNFFKSRTAHCLG